MHYIIRFHDIEIVLCTCSSYLLRIVVLSLIQNHSFPLSFLHNSYIVLNILHTLSIQHIYSLFLALFFHWLFSTILRMSTKTTSFLNAVFFPFLPFILHFARLPSTASQEILSFWLIFIFRIFFLLKNLKRWAVFEINTLHNNRRRKLRTTQKKLCLHFWSEFVICGWYCTWCYANKKKATKRNLFFLYLFVVVGTY